jgi:hypothetical protein
MITFEQVCRHNGLEPKAVRAMLKSGLPYKIMIKGKSDDKYKRECVLKLLKCFSEYKEKKPKQTINTDKVLGVE